MEIFMPKDVKFLIDKIYEHGYEGFMVGGCVRDSILNMIPNDYDITTNAKPDDIIKIFKDYKIIDTGIKHGTVSVVLNDNIYEITTYRIESEYENNRRPKSVEFTTKSNSPYHSKTIFFKSFIWISNCFYYSVFNIFNSIKFIN